MVKDKFNHVMIDIETLGKSVNSVIVQIAAVTFEPYTGEIGEKFSINIDPVSCQKDCGLELDADTVLWWLKQSKEAQNAVFNLSNSSHITEALYRIRNFISEKGDPSIVWANSPSFDLAILKNAFEKTGIASFWEFRNERDVRTITALFPELKDNFQYKGLKHSALDDCLNQIELLHKCYEQIFPTERI